MPGRDQTGPSGAGPMTGRATGLCNTNAPDEMGGHGRGMGRGARCGMGRGTDSKVWARKTVWPTLKNDSPHSKENRE